MSDAVVHALHHVPHHHRDAHAGRPSCAGGTPYAAIANQSMAGIRTVFDGRAGTLTMPSAIATESAADALKLRKFDIKLVYAAA